MRVAGIGFRGAATLASLKDALLRAGGDADALATADAKATAPVMQALARDGAIKMTTNGTARDIAASPPARALITRFLNFCKGSGA